MKPIANHAPVPRDHRRPVKAPRHTVHYEHTLHSLLAAVMEERLSGARLQAPAVDTGDFPPSLFDSPGGDTEDHILSFLGAPTGEDGRASSLGFKDTYRRYRRRFGPVAGLESEILRERFANLLAYLWCAEAGPGRDALAEEAARQALAHGLANVVGGASPEARAFCLAARRVWMEAHRLHAFTRLRPAHLDGREIMVGALEARADLMPLVMAHFRTRFPEAEIVLLCGRRAFIERPGHALEQRPGWELALTDDGDGFDALWWGYYDAQYIPQRRNIRLATRHMPRKYWSWLPEGMRMEREERRGCTGTHHR